MLTAVTVVVVAIAETTVGLLCRSKLDEEEDDDVPDVPFNRKESDSRASKRCEFPAPMILEFFIRYDLRIFGREDYVSTSAFSLTVEAISRYRNCFCSTEIGDQGNKPDEKSE